MLQGLHMPPTRTQPDRQAHPEPLLRSAHATLPTLHATLNLIVCLTSVALRGASHAAVGVQRAGLTPNNPRQERPTGEHEGEVVARLAAHGGGNRHNRGYLEINHRPLGHDFTALFEASETRRR